MATDRPKRTFMSQVETSDAIGHKPHTNYWMTLMHLMKGYIGTGIFAMGLATKDAGLVLGPVTLFFIAVINLHCQHMLLKATQKIIDEEEDEDVKPSFSETVEYILQDSHFEWVRNHSNRLGWMSTVFLLICELGFCCVYFVFIEEHLCAIGEYYGWIEPESMWAAHIILGIILVPMWATTLLGNLKLLAPLSIIANLIMTAAVIAVYYYTALDLPNIRDRKLITSPVQWPIYYSVVLFAFEGITFIIPLRNEMRNPKLYTALHGPLNVSMVLVTILITSVGVMSYWKYGEEVSASVLLDLDEQVHVPLFSLMCIAVAFTFTLHMYIPFEVTFPLFYDKYSPFKYPRLVAIIYRTVPVLVTWMFANIIPFLGSFIALVGATTGTALSLILPPILDTVAFYDTMSRWSLAKNICIIVMSTIGAISGTIVTIMDIVTKFEESYSSKHIKVDY